MNAIATHGLTKVYRGQLGRGSIRSIDGLNLEVREHEVYGFLGRNGAGKTTTIKILCGLLRASAGSAAICGEDVRRRDSRRLIGYLPENPYFYEYLNPQETLDFYGRLHGLSAEQRRAEWDSLSGLLDLRSIAGQRVRGFSKGMRQRLGFAVALVGDPQVLILDEPMSGLDPLGRRNIRELILLMRERKKTIFFSSHVLGDVEQICDRVGILVEGKLTTQGRIDELLTRHVNRVEVIASGLPPATIEQLTVQAERHRESGAGHHFFFAGVDEANAAVRTVHAAGGRLEDFSPLLESLEDYFMRRQEEQP
jgi:ABC-2 type transport system ATP-binding protein